MQKCLSFVANIRNSVTKNLVESGNMFCQAKFVTKSFKGKPLSFIRYNVVRCEQFDKRQYINDPSLLYIFS